MGKTVVIAGASKGLGRNLASHCAKKGYDLALLARNQAELDSLKRELGDILNVTTHPCDLSNQSEVQKSFDCIQSSHKSLHALVNCAGTWTGGKTVLQLSAEDVERSFQLNFYSAFHCTKQVLAVWLGQRGEELHIVNAGATASLRGGKNTCAFALAKSSLEPVS